MRSPTYYDQTKHTSKQAREAHQETHPKDKSGLSTAHQHSRHLLESGLENHDLDCVFPSWTAFIHDVYGHLVHDITATAAATKSVRTGEMLAYLDYRTHRVVCAPRSFRQRDIHDDAIDLRFPGNQIPKTRVCIRESCLLKSALPTSTLRCIEAI